MTVSTYDEVLDLTRRLELREQLRLLETLSRIVRDRITVDKPHSIMELEGLGAEIWQDIDAQHYVDQERSSWDS